ncbi:hypothetical protein DSM21852_07650 [Methylocystis bryophila]|nr:hypothetical protein DSM21852_07650 [Methylocystis bryophila]
MAFGREEIKTIFRGEPASRRERFIKPYKISKCNGKIDFIRGSEWINAKFILEASDDYRKAQGIETRL